MRRGRLKTVDLPIPVDEISSSASQQTLDGEVQWAIQVTDRSESWNGREYVTGRAAAREEVEDDAVRIKQGGDGEIDINKTVARRHQTHYGEWLAVDEGWLVVTDDWVGGLVGSQLPTGVPGNPGLDLQALLSDLGSPNVTQLGFAGRLVPKGGDRGALYGDYVDRDPDLGDELQQTPLNELGVEHHTHEWLQVSAYFAAETAYIEVYDQDFSTRDFVDYVGEFVVEHTREDGDS